MGAEGPAIERNKTLIASTQTGAEAVDAMLQIVLSSLDDDKAEDIVAIDLTGKTSLADHMVIASGRSTRQVAALTHKLVDRLKQAGFQRPGIEGENQADWVVVDAGDVIVHIFRPEVREFYNLEKLWAADVDMDLADEPVKSVAH